VRREGDAQAKAEAEAPAPVWEHDVSRAVREMSPKAAKTAAAAPQSLPTIFHGAKRDDVPAGGAPVSVPVQ